MKNIYVGNLDSTAAEGGLRALFESYGHVGTISIIRDRYTGQSRGFAFVEMSNHNGAEIAIYKLTGQTWLGVASK